MGILETQELCLFEILESLERVERRVAVVERNLAVSLGAIQSRVANVDEQVRKLGAVSRHGHLVDVAVQTEAGLTEEGAADFPGQVEGRTDPPKSSTQAWESRPSQDVRLKDPLSKIPLLRALLLRERRGPQPSSSDSPPSSEEEAGREAATLPLRCERRRRAPEPAVCSSAPCPSGVVEKPPTWESRPEERRQPAAERERRMRQGLCLYCGVKDHYRAQCPKLACQR